MKRSRFMPLAVALVGCWLASPALLAQQSRFTNVAVDTSFVESPRYEVKGIAQEITKDRWLEIRVSYTTAMAAAGDSHEWLDDVTFEYEVLLPRDAKGTNYVLLLGKVDYWSIPMGGKTHHALAHIHPRFLQRYAPDLRMRNTSLKDLYVKVTFKARGAIVGGGFHAPRGKTNADANSMFQRAATMTALTRVNDAVAGRDRTPWLFVNPERYELIKPNGSR